MAIDIASETLILFSDVPSYLPPQPNGKLVHLSTVYRWKSVGIAGVRLESIIIAGCRYTSREALQRFWTRVTAAKDRQEFKPAAAGPTSSADEELEAAGW